MPKRIAFTMPKSQAALSELVEVGFVVSVPVKDLPGDSLGHSNISLDRHFHQ